MNAPAAVAPITSAAAEVMLRVDRARWWALSEQPFYGALLMRLAPVITTATKTASTDGRSIRLNPEYVAGLTDEELRFVLLHEALHCAHLHMWRLPADDRGNIAGDHAINLTLDSVRGITMPAGGLHDPAYRGMAEEDILAALPQPPPPDAPEQGQGDSGAGQGDEGDQGGDQDQGEPGDAPGDGQGDPCGSFSAPGADAPGAVEQAAVSEQLRQEWEQAVISAAQAAQALGRGQLPADLARILERVKANPIDWRRELSEFLRQAGAGRNDWARAARRHAWQSVIYPRRRPDDLGVIICARDTSGSIDSKLVAEFSALIDECVSCTGARVLVIDCDAAIQGEHWIEPGMGCPMTAQGGGGTDFRPVFERADQLADQGERVAGIVYLTDLCGTEPEATDHATLWLSTTATEARTGRTVRVLPTGGAS